MKFEAGKKSPALQVIEAIYDARDKHEDEQLLVTFSPSGWYEALTSFVPREDVYDFAEMENVVTPTTVCGLRAAVIKSQKDPFEIWVKAKVEVRLE